VLREQIFPSSFDRNLWNLQKLQKHLHDFLAVLVGLNPDKSKCAGNFYFQGIAENNCLLTHLSNSNTNLDRVKAS
jgi:hypothetical protein